MAKADAKVQQQRKANNGDAKNKSKTPAMIQQGDGINKKKMAEMLRKGKK